MLIQAFPSGPFSTNAYVAACPLTKAAAIIDPAPESAAAIQTFLNQQALTCKHILLTHSHWDHIADVGALKSFYHARVYIHSLDALNLEHPGSDGLPCWISIEGVQPDVLIEEGSLIQIGHLSFTVLHTPGHTPGGVCFYESKEAVLFSGDTLFKGTIGNLSFPTSQPALMWPSLAKLAQLPPQTKVYPGHGPATTIGAETWLPHAQELFE
ncbi:MBL fold metallo-hydrolase [Candidatus Protochlamydia phocaeensis]|uniref:MBL fold metallo-hydrolase n=1 Tax=Candidatus Protochlamydia phocaeensis TaxID=1414722 RepID=UPI0008386E2D|nr:MBL fold metallo-hydrolase [Candidatus Protochlamydia phocaeensis]